MPETQGTAAKPIPESRLLFRYLRMSLLIPMFLTVSTLAGAQASSIEDLLESVDSTLKGGSKSKKDSDSNDASPKTRRKPTSGGATPAEQARPAENDDPEAAKKTLSAPRIFEVPENVQITRSEAPRRKNRVHLGLLRRTMQGGGKLDKDEDSFQVKAGEAIFGGKIGADREVYSSEGSAKSSNDLLAFIGGDVEVFRGALTVKRTGVYNEEFSTDFTIVDWFLRTGVEWELAQSVFLGGFLGFGGETINQTGRGVTDSTSGGFTTDKLGLTLSYELSEEFLFNLSLQKNGAVFARSADSPKSLSLGMFLTARL